MSTKNPRSGDVARSALARRLSPLLRGWTSTTTGVAYIERGRSAAGLTGEMQAEASARRGAFQR